MESTTSFLIVVLGYLAFGISAIIWISKKKKAGEKISMRAKIIIAAVFLSSSSVLISSIELPPTPGTGVSEDKVFYVEAKRANVRECPSTSCKIIDTLFQNEKLTFPGDLYDKYPEWAEITFPNGQLGYVNKTTLSENIVPENQLTPTDDSSSIGGITIGPWNNIQTVIGESYELPFCEPPSAISGATCGALADTTTDPRGGTPPYSFIKKSGFLPPGMTLELNGTLRGSPTQTGTYEFRLCAKDLYGGEGCQNLAVVVKEKEATGGLSPQEATPSADTALDITISGTCRLIKDEVNQDGNVVAHWYTVEFGGTASGPVGSYISYQSQKTMFEQYGYADSWQKLESSWTPDRGTEKRGVGDPPTTAWKYTLNNGYSGGSTKNYFRIWIKNSGPFGGLFVEKELRVDCP